MVSPIPIFSLTQKAYAKAVLQILGKGESHAKKVYSEWFKKGKVDLLGDWIEPQAKPLVENICAITNFFTAPLSSAKEEEGVKKFLLKYEGGLEAESVILPMAFGNTLCISSQIGCRMGCAFCETGKMGLLRSLTVEEIVFQVFAAKFLMGASIRNIVFMGMGEPFDNYTAVMQAIEVLSCPTGLGIPCCNITVSTSGKVEEIYRFAKEADPSLRLAISLNAPSDEIRFKIMPINKEFDLLALKGAMEEYGKNPKREILVEYVLLDGINDSILAADLVAEYLRGLRVKINLIPYNAQRRGPFAPPSQEKIEQFQRRLKEKGYSAMLRITRGRSIMAACGQLGNREIRKSLRILTQTSLRKHPEVV